MAYKDLADKLEAKFGDKTLGKIEDELGITEYNYTGAFSPGTLKNGPLPRNKKEAMKLFDPTTVGKLSELSIIFEFFASTGSNWFDDCKPVRARFCKRP